MNNLFNSVTEEDVLKYNGKFLVGDKLLSTQEGQEIVRGAIVIKEMDVWKYLVKDLKNSANLRMFQNSVSTDDLMFGKAMLYCIDVLEKKLDNLSNIK